MNLITQGVEVGLTHRRNGLRRGARQQQAAQCLAILVLTDEIEHVLTTDAIATRTNLFAHKGLELIDQRNVPRSQGETQ